MTSFCLPFGGCGHPSSPGTQMPCFVILFPKGWAFEGASCSWRSPCLGLRCVWAACPAAPPLRACVSCPLHLSGPGVRCKAMTVLGRRSLGPATACRRKERQPPPSCPPSLAFSQRQGARTFRMEAPGLCGTPIPSCRLKKSGKVGPHVGMRFLCYPAEVPEQLLSNAHLGRSLRAARPRPPLPLIPLPLAPPPSAPPALGPAPAAPSCPAGGGRQPCPLFCVPAGPAQ